MGMRDEPLLLFDGACGTNIQKMNLPASAWKGRYAGYNEYLNLSAPDAIASLHAAFIDAGANVVETNSFGANRIVAAEYGLEKEVPLLNRRAVENAKTAIAGRPGLYVAGSIGPTTKLPSLGHISVAELRAAYLEQMRALIEAGVDALIIETCQDLLQIKTGLVAAFDLLREMNADLPVMVSVTVESTGTLLLGTSIDAVITALEPFPCFSLGLNCATGPAEMDPHVAKLSRRWPGRISIIPNAGMPEVVQGQTVYPLSPDSFAEKIASFVRLYGASIVGGCCGTTPDHILALKNAIFGLRPSRPAHEPKPALGSLYESIDASQEIPPTLVGERMNANGSKKFRSLLLKDDYDAAAEVGRSQEAAGAHLLDLCCAYAGRDEKKDLVEMIRRLGTSVKIPLVIDSTAPDAVEAALEVIPGRPVINSINLEDGGRTLGRICNLAKRYGAAVVALAIGPDGMAMTADDKIAVAKEIHRLAVDRYGLRPHDLFFDMLTFTIGSGDVKLESAATATLDAIRRVKKELPGVLTLLGVSNISFGLPPESRKVLNSIFLAEAIEAGLDAAIVDPSKILPVAAIPEEERRLCLDLIYHRKASDGPPPLDAFIEHFSRTEAKKGDAGEAGPVSLEKQLEQMVQGGDTEHLDDALAALRERYRPIEIINQILVPTMRRIGELFGRGEMLLPFVLKSAEVMKRSVDILEPFMDKVESGQKRKILLATVQGDVHDIGKNLVDIILSNNGFDVVNIGINIPTETIVARALEHRVDAVGLSGLLVKSAVVMQESMPLLKNAGLEVPILLGGAALTPRFVAESCVPAYGGPVVYCRDAFDGLRAMQRLETGGLESTALPRSSSPRTEPAEPSEEPIARNNPVPRPPFLGARHVEAIDPALLFPEINRQALFRGRWGFRRGKATAEDYARLIREKAEPAFEALKRRALEETLLAPKAAYGYFRCAREGDSLVVEAGGAKHRFDFPRQRFGTRRSIVDYFRSAEEGGDLAGFFVVTLGEKIVQETRKLFEANAYQDYLLMHGFAAETTDALAEYWHRVMRDDLGIGKPEKPGIAACSCQGTRYGFGYPACPDLDQQRTLFALLDPGRIGVSLTERMEMVPEVSTSAIIVHHPDARYFAV